MWWGESLKSKENCLSVITLERRLKVFQNLCNYRKLRMKKTLFNSFIAYNLINNRFMIYVGVVFINECNQGRIQGMREKNL